MMGLGPIEIVLALFAIVAVVGVPVGLAIFLLRQRRKK
jgi:hypothetical protein